MIKRVLAIVGGRGRSLPIALGLDSETIEISALSIVERSDDKEILLRAARGGGAVRVVALWDEGVAHTDYYGLAQVLAAASRKIGFDVIVCSDGARGILGPALADQLGIPHLTGVVAAVVRDGRLVVDRPSGGRLRRYEAASPVLITVAARPLSDAAAEAPPAGTVKVERWTLTDVGIAAAELRARQRLVPGPMAPSPPAKPRTFSGPSELAQRLADDGLLPRTTPQKREST